MSTTSIVRIRRHKGDIVQSCDVYIGRAVRRGGWDLPASKWANPFTVAQCGSAEAAVAEYRKHLMRRPDLIAALPELRAKVLGCFCKPDACHGDVLVEMVNALE